MTEREQLVREAEELAAWLESIESWQISDKAFQTHSKQALTVRRLLSLLPKEGAVDRYETARILLNNLPSLGSMDMANKIVDVLLDKALIEARPR